MKKVLDRWLISRDTWDYSSNSVNINFESLKLRSGSRFASFCSYRVLHCTTKGNFWHIERVLTVVNAVMPPISETQHRNPWQVSLQRIPLNFSGKFISRNGKIEFSVD